MTREIKFRGKDFLGRWHYGYLHLATGSSNLMIQVDSFDSFGVLPETVGQFTGLLDKNEKEIWEHDIVDWNGVKLLVEFIDGIFCMRENYENAPLYDMFLERGEINVIGNVFDNPELLETETL